MLKHRTMNILYRLAMIFVVITSIQSCKFGAAWWGNYDKSPADFAGMEAEHYFVSVGVSWSDGSFDDYNDKGIRIYVADDRLGVDGERSGKLYRDTWTVEGGAVTVAYDWMDDVVTVQILETSSNKVLLTKSLRIDGRTATLLPGLTKQ